MKQGLIPERIQVLADGRGRRFRYWNFDQSPVQRDCTISAVGRYRGLHVGAARTVALEDPAPDLLAAYEPAAMIAATGMYFSQANWEFFEIWNRVRRIYEKTGVASEWHQADIEDVVEYEFGSIPLMPRGEYRLSEGVPLFWHPSVGPVLMGDTILVHDGPMEILTSSPSWPTLCISVKGTNITVPAMLVIKP